MLACLNDSDRPSITDQLRKNANASEYPVGKTVGVLNCTVANAYLALYYHRTQEIAAENMPLIYTTRPERLNAVRNVFGNTI